MKPVPVLPVAASSFAIPARTPRFKGFRISAWKLSVYRDLGFRTCLGIVFRFSGCRAAKTVSNLNPMRHNSMRSSRTPRAMVSVLAFGP